MTPPTPIPIPRFATTQLALLHEEHAAEVSSSKLASTAATVSPSTRRTLQATGYALTGLILSQCRTGLGGRVVGEFAPDPAVASEESRSADGTPRLGSHGIRVGDVVRVSDIAGSGKRAGGKDKDREREKDTEKGVEGVVTRTGDRAVWIAFGRQGGGGMSKEEDEAVEGLWGKKVWAMKLANDVTYRRMRQTMEKMVKMTETEYSHFMRVAFGHTTPLQLDSEACGPVEFTDPTLNDSQKDAIRFALAGRDIALIHVCGPSNVSVDNIVERLAPKKVPVVRIGHPARLLPSVLEHSLEVLTQTSDAGGIVKDIRKEIDEKQASIRKTRSGRERRGIYDDLKLLRKEFRQRESKCVDNLVRESSVVLATLHGAGGHQLKNQKFDVVIIDEASQALEAQCWISLLGAEKVVLAGDHLQLPPTVKSTGQKPKENNSKGTEDKTDTNTDMEILKGVSLERTLFDRLLALHGPGIKRMLTTQYRMHEKIMRFPSDELYEGKLIASDAVKDRLLIDLPYDVEGTDDTQEPLVFWDTQSGDFPEKAEDEISKKGVLLGDSKSNEMEAMVVARHVDNLINAGVRPESVAVITPYNGQLALLSRILREKYPGLELGSVDGFQGREKEAVVVSLVRSNAEREVGFLGEKRRLNVAMTRPKRHLCICGDSETISHGSSFLKHWMAFLEEHADLRYPDAGDLL
ncbi:hypothetical protein PDIDSM_1340 [Penicillium digitatum]|nr:hypothetical protein PDIDSM_1340 [Penicillium digitatum]